MAKKQKKHASKYAKKVEKRARLANKLGVEPNTPMPILKRMLGREVQ